MTNNAPVSVRECSLCHVTWMNYRMSDGRYYCKVCKRKFDPPHTKLPPTPDIPQRAFTKARKYVIGIKDHKTHAPTPTNKAHMPRGLR